MDGTRAKGQKKGKVGDGDEDAAESATVKGAEMEEFKADIKKDIQDMKYAQERDIQQMDAARWRRSKRRWQTSHGRLIGCCG